MKISYAWLNNYLNLELPADQLATLLTDIGLEVESVNQVESIKGGLKGVVIGQVLTKIQHPNADRLAITTVNIVLLFIMELRALQSKKVKLEKKLQKG